MSAKQLFCKVESMETDNSEESRGSTTDDINQGPFHDNNLRRTKSAAIVIRGAQQEEGISPFVDQDALTKSPRSRTLSAGSQFISMSPMTLNVDCGSISPSPKACIGSPAPRVVQLKREESIDEVTREVAKERDTVSTIQLSRSLDEITSLAERQFGVADISETASLDNRRNSLDEYAMCPSPSTSVASPGRLIFIDKFYQNRSLTPSPIGTPISPKQRTLRRSLSPSHLRPSLLSSLPSKRKLDPDDPDHCMATPPKRIPYNSSISTTSSVSSCSSPDHPSDTNSSLLSCDEDSGNEQMFQPHASIVSMTPIMTPITPASSPLTCDTRHPSQTYGFVKPHYVAPQSPLAAGVNSASILPDSRMNKLKPSGYSFTRFAALKDPLSEH